MRSLRWDMDALAVETWTRIHVGDRRNIRLREDTITELNLLDLDARHPELAVHRFNQTAERQLGADWEWWLGSGTFWFALRIQAKRMDGLEYRKLGHEGAEGDDYQYDTLIRSSKEAANLTFPFYVFFNGWDSWPTGVNWHGCPNGKPLGHCTHASDRELGCSLMPADLVRHIHAGRGKAGRLVGEYLPYSVPWSWILGRPPVPSPLVSERQRATSGSRDPGTGPAPMQSREWGAAAGAPRTPTLIEVLRWHRAWAWVATEIGSGQISLDELAPNGGLSRLVSERYAEVRPSLEGLQRLPAYAETVRQLRDRPLDESAMRDLAGVASLAGPEPLLVLVTELPFDQPQDVDDLV